MNQTQTISAPKSAASQPPVCRTVPLQRVPGAERRELASCKAPVQDSAEQLTRAFQAAPQFSQIVLDKVLARKGKGSFRMVLLGENDYYLRQAAAYLTAIARKSSQKKKAAPADDFWNDLDMDDYFKDEEPALTELLKDSLEKTFPRLQGKIRSCNIGCVIGVFPTTGKPLPFISSGGSSLIASYMMVGIILSVSEDVRGRDVYERRRDNLEIVRPTGNKGSRRR